MEYKGFKVGDSFFYKDPFGTKNAFPVYIITDMTEDHVSLKCRNWDSSISYMIQCLAYTAININYLTKLERAIYGL